LKISIHLERERCWRWVYQLVTLLDAAGHTVSVRLIDTPGAALSGDLAMLLGIEARLHRLGELRQSKRLPPAAFARFAEDAFGDPDVVLDLSMAPALPSGPGPGVPRLVPLYNGYCNEEGLFSSLLQGLSPEVTIVDFGKPAIVADAMVAVDDPTVMARAIEQVFARLQTIFTMALLQPHPVSNEGRVASAHPGKRFLAGYGATFGFLAREITGKLRGRLSSQVHNDHHWAIAWRRVSTDGIWATGSMTNGRFQVLPDDGQRFFADPFPLWHNGRLHVFCEEYPYLTGRGIISHFEIGEDGTATRPVPVLETGYHLSYPFVFEHEGGLWMIPETSANQTIELWRARDFPSQWELHSVLVSGVAAVDATLIEHAGRFWLFASTKHEDSSIHDALQIWHAERLQGPWQPISDTPVLVDARAARPAGRMREINGSLWRPAQDCTRTYGGKLTLCRVDNLRTDGHYAQTRMHLVAAEGSFAPHGPHTLNELAGFEFIDLRGAETLSSP
jgi:hypothetical protein